MAKSTEEQPEAVSEKARRAGEILRRWCWVEPLVWTMRMLTALEQGVKGGKWFSLIDKVHPERILRAAFSQVAANKGAAGVDHTKIINDLTPRLRGWFEYFKHSHRYTFSALDGWIRMRLRSILRKRLGKEGRGRGSDHQRWPNEFFAKHGLYSLKKAHAMACQSSSG